MVETKKPVQKPLVPKAVDIDNPWEQLDGPAPAPTPPPATNAPLAVSTPGGERTDWAPGAPAAYPHAAMPQVELRHTSDRMSGGLVRVSSIITPVSSVEEAVKAWALFNRLKETLLTKEDYYLIRGRGVARAVPTRTGWRKLGLFFGVSTEVVEEKRWQRGDVFGYDFMVRAVAPNGQMMVGVGSCDSAELLAQKAVVTEHNARAKAHTRATNRAISDLIGGGELSAEEVDGQEVGDAGDVSP